MALVHRLVQGCALSSPFLEVHIRTIFYAELQHAGVALCSRLVEQRVDVLIQHTKH